MIVKTSCGTDGALHSTTVDSSARCVVAPLSACYEGDNENQLLDQRCRHNIKIICNLSSRGPAAQTTVHCPQERQWEQYIWGVKGTPSPTMSPSLFPLASLLVKYNIRNKNWCKMTKMLRFYILFIFFFMSDFDF